jgi:hypothetical protein
VLARLVYGVEDHRVRALRRDSPQLLEPLTDGLDRGLAQGFPFDDEIVGDGFDHDDRLHPEARRRGRFDQAHVPSGCPEDHEHDGRLLLGLLLRQTISFGPLTGGHLGVEVLDVRTLEERDRHLVSPRRLTARATHEDQGVGPGEQGHEPVHLDSTAGSDASKHPNHSRIAEGTLLPRRLTQRDRTR